jgi:hypothetical protein
LRSKNAPNSEKIPYYTTVRSRVCQPLFPEPKARTEKGFRYAAAERILNPLVGTERILNPLAGWRAASYLIDYYLNMRYNVSGFGL